VPPLSRRNDRIYRESIDLFSAATRDYVHRRGLNLTVMEGFPRFGGGGTGPKFDNDWVLPRVPRFMRSDDALITASEPR
jgi:hypothetical protein